MRACKILCKYILMFPLVRDPILIRRMRHASVFHLCSDRTRLHLRIPHRITITICSLLGTWPLPQLLRAIQHLAQRLVVDGAAQSLCTCATVKPIQALCHGRVVVPLARALARQALQPLSSLRLVSYSPSASFTLEYLLTCSLRSSDVEPRLCT